MYDLDEKIKALKKYFRKLQTLIDDKASFTLIKTKIIRKKQIDDLLCCIEATYPDDYKKFIERGVRKLKSNMYYIEMLDSIKNNFWLNNSFYAVRYKETERLILGVLSALDSDMRFIYSNDSGMFLD